MWQRITLQTVYSIIIENHLVFGFVFLSYLLLYFSFLHIRLLVVSMAILIDFFLQFLQSFKGKPFFIPNLITVEQMIIPTAIQVYNVALSSTQSFV